MSLHVLGKLFRINLDLKHLNALEVFEKNFISSVNYVEDTELLSFSV